MRNGSIALAAAAALVGCTESQPCPRPLDVCDGVCVDTRQDVDYCGNCQTSCLPGQVCLDGGCLESTLAPCDERAGGAYVLLATCGQSVKAWAADPVFIETAEARVGLGPAAPYPVLDVRDGTDCDGQWTWHADPATVRFEAAPVGCAICPGDIEANKADWIGGVWCPDPVEFLLVERRP